MSSRPGVLRSGPVPAARRSHATRHTLPRSIAVSLLCTGLDFGTLWALVELAGVGHPLATFAGTVVGAITNFVVNRQYTFDAVGEDAAHRQLVRFLVVQAGCSALLTAGMWLVADVLGVAYLVARLIVAVVVYLGWNYPMIRFYVFARRPAAPAG